MVYVEWLRVRRTLLWTAVAMAVMVVVLVIGQVLFLTLATTAPLGDVKFDNGKTGEMIARSSLTTHTVLPDGTKRTIVDDSKEGVRITIDDLGYRGRHIEIFEAAGSQEPKVVNAGPIDFRVTRVPGGTLTTFDTNAPETLAYHAGFAGIVALIVATILGAPFARENDGHLEIAFSKPISRTRLALETVLVDLAGIAGAWAMTVVFFFIAHSVVSAPNYVLGPYDLPVVALGLAGAFSWYAMLSAATASMKRNYGAVQGIAWPVAGLILLLAKVKFGDSQLAHLVQWIATPFAWILPFNYLHFGIAYTVNGQAQGSMAVAPYSELPALLLLALVYGVLAILQWRRVEA
jgi:hypothetical protein